MNDDPFPAEQTEFEVWQGGIAVAFTDSLQEAHRYLRTYRQDGPAQIVVAVTTRCVLKESAGASQ